MVRLIIPVVTSTATAVIATLFVTSSAATAAAAEASFLEATATAALLFRLGLVHDDLTTHNLRVVQVGNSLLSLGIVFHFDETKALAATGNFVFHDLGACYSTVLLKKVSEILIGHLP